MNPASLDITKTIYVLDFEFRPFVVEHPANLNPMAERNFPRKSSGRSGGDVHTFKSTYPRLGILRLLLQYVKKDCTCDLVNKV